MEKDKPTTEEFQKLVQWLETAGLQYQKVHAWLTRIFVLKGFFDAESLADDVLDRVAKRIDHIVTKYKDCLACLQGFARNVEHEERTKQQRTTDIEDSRQFVAPNNQKEIDERERDDRCLTLCLKKLKKKEQDLMLRYYQSIRREKIEERKKLATEWRLTLEGLRTKVHRLSKKLFECMQNCLKADVSSETA